MLVRPKVEYAAIGWEPCSKGDSARLEKYNEVLKQSKLQEIEIRINVIYMQLWHTWSQFPQSKVCFWYLIYNGGVYSNDNKKDHWESGKPHPPTNSFMCHKQ